MSVVLELTLWAVGGVGIILVGAILGAIAVLGLVDGVLHAIDSWDRRRVSRDRRRS